MSEVTVETVASHAHDIKGDRGFVRVGKKAAGRTLDGREWSAMPEGAR